MESNLEQKLASYRLLKIIITANRGESMVQLARIAFSFVPQVISVTNPNGSSPYREEAHNLLDGQLHTKWLDFNLQRNGSSELIFVVGSERTSLPTPPKSKMRRLWDTVVYPSSPAPNLKPTYQLWTANDFPQRDPTSWILMGQHVGSTDWDILDIQDYVEPPHSRHTAYPEFVLNFGTRTAARQQPHALPRLLRMPSMEILPALDPTLNGFDFEVLPEYRRAKEAVVVKWEFMATSKLQTALKAINDMRGSLPKVSFGDTLCQVIAKAYNITVASARRQYCSLGDYNLFREITNLYNALEWRREYLHIALWASLQCEEPTGLMTCLNLLARGGNECHARKLMAFHSFVQRIAASSSSSTSVGPSSSSHSSSSVEHARMLLLDWMQDYIDNLKLKAFTSTFLEPAKFYFHQTNQTVMMDDVEVHGSNTYLAVLLSTLGIKLGLMPYFRDEVKGCCDFLQATSYASIYKEITDPKHLGKHWGSIPKARQCSSRPNVYINSGFIIPGDSPLVVAFYAASSSTPGDSRRAVARYLELYTQHFSKEHFFEKAFIKLIGDEGLPKPLAIVFEAMMMMTMMSEEGSSSLPSPRSSAAGGDVKEWVYDVDNDYTFSLERAAQLFAFIGVTTTTTTTTTTTATKFK